MSPNHIEEEWDAIDLQLIKALKDASRANRIEKIKFKELWHKFKDEEGMGFKDFIYNYARKASLEDFYIFALISGLPLNRNPIYAEIIDIWKANSDLIEAGDPNGKPITICMLPRGALKSTIQLNKGAWSYLRGAILFNKAPIIMIAHSDIDKGQENLTLIRETFDKDIIKRLFYDVLDFTTKSKKSIRFKDTSKVKRKEDHFFLSSPNTSQIGRHMSLALIDDWATSNNTNTIQANEQNKDAFYKMLSLDDHSEGDKISLVLDVVCTEYCEDSIYRELEGNPDVLFLKYPACTRQFEVGQLEPHEFKFPEILGEKKLALLKRALPYDQFISQYDLISYTREKTINFDCELPEWDDVPPLNKRAYVAVLADPSQSKKNKKSQAVVLVAIITTEGNIYVVDGIANFGMSTAEHAHFINLYAEKWQANVAIVEVIAYQIALKQELERLIRTKSSGHRYAVKGHRHFIGKKEHYKNFLEPLLMQQRIFINPKLTELINQINGKSSLDDAVDTLSFLSDLKIDNLAMLKPKPDPTGYHELPKRKPRKDSQTSSNAFGWW